MGTSNLFSLELSLQKRLHWTIDGDNGKETPTQNRYVEVASDRTYSNEVGQSK